MVTGMNAVKVKDAPDAVYNFSASGGNATENFQIISWTQKNYGYINWCKL